MDVCWLLENHQDKYEKQENGCWVWMGARAGGNRPGESEGKYGFVAVEGEMRYVHRIAAGDVPEGAHVLHSCDNPPCFNPDHLHIGDRSMNQKEAYARGGQESRLEVLADARETTGNDQTGADHPASRLSEDERQEIYKRYHGDTDLLQRELAAEFGVSRATVSRVVREVDHAE